MKKLLMGLGAAAILLGAASCSKNASTATPEDKAFGDSLSMTLGEFGGLRLNSAYDNVPDDQRKMYKKEDILRGFKAVIMNDSLGQGFVVGATQAAEINNQLLNFEMSGIPVDRAKVYEAYAKAFMADTINPEDMQTIANLYRELSMKAQERAMMEQARRDEEARQAEAKADTYVQELVAKDPSYTLSPSGIAYKVTREGEGPVVGKGGKAVVKYTGRLTDGTVFDSNDQGVEFATNQVVPGFGEAISMMNKGEQLTVVIPASLGYGNRDHGPIPANSTLVFDIEVVDLTPAN